MADFELSFSGTRPFRLPSPDLLARIERYLRVTDHPLFATPAPSWPGANADRLLVDRPAAPPGLGLYELFVPSGASRWSVFRGLVHKTDLPDSSSRVATLRMKAGGPDTVAVTMQMLPPQPLTGLDGAADLYLVTLVDDRYLGGPFPSASIQAWADASSTWNGFITNAAYYATNFGSTGFNPADILPAYGWPELDSDLYAWDGSPGVLCDAALANCGMVLTWDWSVAGNPWKALRWSAANAYADAARATLSDHRAAGGKLFGGDTDPHLAKILPRFIKVNFPEWVDGLGYANFFRYGTESRPHRGSEGFDRCYSITVDATTLGSPYNALPTYSSVAPLILNTTAKAVLSELSQAATVTNQSALQALAEQLARDVYDYARQSVVESYRGIRPFDPRGGLDVAYGYWPEPLTRVWRRPLNSGPQEFQHNLDGVKSISFPGRQVSTLHAPVKVTSLLSGSVYVGRRVFDNDRDVTAWAQVPAAEPCVVVGPNGETLTVGKVYECRLSNANPNTYGNVWVAVAPRPIPLPVSEGGTGQTTLTSGQLLYGNGTSSLGSVGTSRLVGGNLELKLGLDRWATPTIGTY